MGFDSSGYEQQKLQYETGETRPVNPPTPISGSMAISDETTYVVGDFIKVENWPNVDWSLWLEDSNGDMLKSILDAYSGDASEEELSFTYGNYQFAIDVHEAALAPLPQAQTIEAILVAELDGTEEQKRSPVTLVPDVACYTSFTTYDAEVAENEPFPYTVHAVNFIDQMGGCDDFQISADNGVTWDTTYEIAVAPDVGVPVPFWIRATSPCVTADDEGVNFFRLGPV